MFWCRRRRFDTDNNFLNADSVTGQVTHVVLPAGTFSTEYYCCTNAASAATRTGAWGAGSYCMCVVAPRMSRPQAHDIPAVFLNP